MSATETACLCGTRARGRGGGKVVGGLAVVGVPDDRQAQADQAEGHQALDGTLGAGAGLADAGQVAGVQEHGLG
jgi:hypothetical protein